jgi:CRP/FNR family transcriptional regulator, cyclic AMP receptor protein
MTSGTGYVDSALLRRALRVGASDCADLELDAPRGAAARLERLGAVLRRLVLEAWRGIVAMAAANGAGTAEGPVSDVRAALSGTGAPEPPEEKPASQPPEGVAVQRHGNADLLELLRGEPVTTVLQPGEILFKEGDLGSTMYLVRSGVLRIRSGSIVYEDVAAGGIVGEMGLVEKHMPRSATIYALQQSELVEIDEAHFAQLVERKPSFAITVMRILSRRLRHMDRRYRFDEVP